MRLKIDKVVQDIIYIQRDFMQQNMADNEKKMQHSFAKIYCYRLFKRDEIKISYQK